MFIWLLRAFSVNISFFVVKYYVQKSKQIMGNKTTKITNWSGDRKYFTIIPNYILNHSTIWDREVYIQMKRITGESGTCWTSKKNLADQCGMSVSRLKKSISYLLEHHWIELIGERKTESSGGKQSTKEYKVVDLWDKNVHFYQDKGGSSENQPLTKGGSSETYKEEPINKNPYKKNPEVGSSFDLFWSKYPKKINKATALKSFNSLKPNSQLLTKILESIDNFIETEEWKKDSGRFIPYPSTWLNNKRWEDEIIKLKKPKVFTA